MSGEISSANELFIQEAIVAGRYQDRAELLDAAVTLLRDEEETLTAIRAGLESIDRGEGISLAEADLRLRTKFGFAPRQ
ncbi:ribbon-helix-helix domain-containing protein [Lacipirellula sp.]|uniref:ribbon-helix-helix domain-containing protein n=1 Tax=Lacipirellula sp. TaxID=2691419 RepID=UPI003D0D84D9